MVKAKDQVTVTDVTDAYSIALTSETYTFAGTTSGAPPGLSCTTQVVAYCGVQACAEVTVGEIICPDGISAVVSGNSSISPTITFTTIETITESCEATIPISVDGVTINRKFSFAVAKTGEAGDTSKLEEDVVNRMTSIQSDIDKIDMIVSQLSKQTGFALGNALQDYEGYDIPTLYNYPTFTDFFIWDVCSETLKCADDLICGINDYDSHEYNVYKSTKYNEYYAFKKTDGVYSWMPLTAAEYEILSSQYASIKIEDGKVKMYAAENEESSYMELTPSGVKTNKIF